MACMSFASLPPLFPIPHPPLEPFSSCPFAIYIPNSSDEESWGGTTPREWEKDTVPSWSASAPSAPVVSADAPSPSSTVAGQMPTRWRATARIEPPDSPFVAMAVTPTVSPDATPSAVTPSRKKSSSRRRKSVGAWVPAPPAPPASAERPSERRRMWVDLERPLPSPQHQQWQREQAVVGEVGGVEGEEVGAVGIDRSVLRSTSAAEAAAAAGLAAAAVERATVTAIAGEGERAGGGDRSGGGGVPYDEGVKMEMDRLRARVVSLEKSYEEREAMYEVSAHCDYVKWFGFLSHSPVYGCVRPEGRCLWADRGSVLVLFGRWQPTETFDFRSMWRFVRTVVHVVWRPVRPGNESARTIDAPFGQHLPSVIADRDRSPLQPTHISQGFATRTTNPKRCSSPFSRRFWRMEFCRHRLQLRSLMCSTPFCLSF